MSVYAQIAKNNQLREVFQYNFTAAVSFNVLPFLLMHTQEFDQRFDLKSLISGIKTNDPELIGYCFGLDCEQIAKIISDMAEILITGAVKYDQLGVPDILWIMAIYNLHASLDCYDYGAWDENTRKEFASRLNNMSDVARYLLQRYILQSQNRYQKLRLQLEPQDIMVEIVIKTYFLDTYNTFSNLYEKVCKKSI